MKIDLNPDYVEFAEVDGIWARAYTLEKRHQVASQHVHEHDHITLLASGSVALWRNGEQVSKHIAPALITVPAGDKHAFVALTDNVVLCCLHNLRGTGLEAPAIAKEVTI